MRCPKCNAIIPSNSLFCPSCGSKTEGFVSGQNSPKSDPFSSLGDLNPGKNGNNTQDNNVTSSSHHGDITRVYYVGNDGLWRDKEVVEMKQEIPPVKKRNTLFCTGCGNPTPADSVFCEHCGKQLLAIPTQKKFQWKKWMIAVACCVVLIIGIIFVSAGHNSTPDSGGYLNGENAYAAPLSDSCDFVLCQGTDTSGNAYELVANQTESSLGYEITVGVIKNNEWLYPMSADFPFLWEDGLFHVTAPMGGNSGSDLSHYGTIAQAIYFVDSGAFLMESYNTKTATGLNLYDHTYLIFSCDTLKSCVIDTDEYTFLYNGTGTKFYDDRVEYGRIKTDAGKLILHKETTESDRRSGDPQNHIYDWDLLDFKTLDISPIAKNVVGIYPKSILSEGLVFASDRCFYNTKLQKIIDLSAYTIDTSAGNNLYFDGGTCTFTAENSLGTEFLLTIDKSGNVLSEVEK